MKKNNNQVINDFINTRIIVKVFKGPMNDISLSHIFFIDNLMSMNDHVFTIQQAKRYEYCFLVNIHKVYSYKFVYTYTATQCQCMRVDYFIPLIIFI